MDKYFDREGNLIPGVAGLFDGDWYNDELDVIIAENYTNYEPDSHIVMMFYIMECSGTTKGNYSPRLMHDRMIG